jgi:Secretion system C-terminal sorting domain
MKKNISLLFILLALFTKAQNFLITNVRVEKNNPLKELIFTMEVAGTAGATTPVPIGTLNNAPVLGYVFPTTLNSNDVGFGNTTGIVALALTSHPDFDDTPLWDENIDANFTNDGIIWHPHWVLLENNTSVPGGLAVKATSASSILPPTNPGMPMYMDSPGFQVVLSGNKIVCTVPYTRVNNNLTFNYDGVTALMKVSTGSTLPMLGVYSTYAIASGSLTLPYTVGNYSEDTLEINISTSSNTIGLINPELITIYPNPTSSAINVNASAGLISAGNYKIEILNLVGNVVYQSQISSANSSISISTIGSIGTYVVKIIDTNTSMVKSTKKLILK